MAKIKYSKMHQQLYLEQYFNCRCNMNTVTSIALQGGAYLVHGRKNDLCLKIIAGGCILCA